MTGLGGNISYRAVKYGIIYYEIQPTTSIMHSLQAESCYSARQWSSLGCRNLAATSVFEWHQPGCMIAGRIPRSPSCASLATSVATARYPISLIVPHLCLFHVSPSLFAPQHRRSLVLILVKELSIRSIMIRWRYPFPWHYAWQGDAYASGAVEPAGSGSACELLAEVGGEVVAVFGEQVVRGSLELLGGLTRLA